MMPCRPWFAGLILGLALSTTAAESDTGMSVLVHAASVNPVDTDIRETGIPGLADASLPYIPGFDLSGAVAETRADVARFASGDAIYAMLDALRME